MSLSRSGLLALALALTIPAAAQAQRSEDESGWRLGALGGWTFPTGDLSDVAKSGWNAGGFIERTQLLSNVSTRIEYLYNSHDSDLNVLGQPVSGGVDTWTLTVNGIVGADPAMKARPYLIGGIGLGNANYDFDAVDFESSTGFTYNIGVGLRFRLTRFDLLLESRFNSIFADDVIYFFPVSFGIRF